MATRDSTRRPARRSDAVPASATLLPFAQELDHRARQLDARLPVHAHEFRGEAKVLTQVERFGLQRDPTFHGQFDFELDAAAGGDFLIRLNQAAAEAEIVNTQRQIEGTETARLEGAGHTRGAPIGLLAGGA